MESESVAIVKTLFPYFDSHYHDYVSEMIEFYRQDYVELKNELITFLKATYPKLSENEIIKILESICKVMNISQEINTNSDLSLKLGELVAVKNSINQPKNSTVSLASKAFFARTSNLDKKKLDRENQKIIQKSERRLLNANVKTLNKNFSEMSVTQANRKSNVDPSRKVDIKLEDFNLFFGSRVLLSNANISIVYGRRYGLVGRNGYGKTTLLNAISKKSLNIPSSIKILHVEQEVDGDNTIVIDSVLNSDSERLELLKEEENIHNQLSSHDLEISQIEMLNERLKKIYVELDGMSAEEARSKIAVILTGLGFTPEAQLRPTKTFSGGWRMRIALARALFCKPDLLLLDEPTNMLDLKVLYWLENYLNTWDGTILIVSHDKKFLDAIATDIIHLTNNQLMSYRGNYSLFDKTRKERNLNQKRQYETQQVYIKHVQAFIDRFGASAARASQAQSRVKMLEKLPDVKPVEEEPDVVFKFMETERLRGFLIRLDNIYFSYHTEMPILRGLSLAISTESRVAIVGDNGSGKSTLLKILIGELSPKEGTVQPHPNLRVGYFAQHHVDQLRMDKSSIEVLASKYPGKSELEYRSHLGSFGISGDLALRPVCTLSGGQKSRTAFAIIAMKRPNFLILDEPTNHLDIETVDALIKALKTFNGAVLLVSHNEHLIRTVATEVYECRKGSLKLFKEGIDGYCAKISKEYSVSLAL